MAADAAHHPAWLPASRFLVARHAPHAHPACSYAWCFRASLMPCDNSAPLNAPWLRRLRAPSRLAAEIFSASSMPEAIAIGRPPLPILLPLLLFDAFCRYRLFSSFFDAFRAIHIGFFYARYSLDIRMIFQPSSVLPSY